MGAARLSKVDYLESYIQEILACKKQIYKNPTEVINRISKLAEEFQNSIIFSDNDYMDFDMVLFRFNHSLAECLHLYDACRLEDSPPNIVITSDGEQSTYSLSANENGTLSLMANIKSNIGETDEIFGTYRPLGERLVGV